MKFLKNNGEVGILEVKNRVFFWDSSEHKLKQAICIWENNQISVQQLPPLKQCLTQTAPADWNLLCSSGNFCACGCVWGVYEEERDSGINMCLPKLSGICLHALSGNEAWVQKVRFPTSQYGSQEGNFTFEALFFRAVYISMVPNKINKRNPT